MPGPRAITPWLLGAVLAQGCVLDLGGLYPALIDSGPSLDGAMGRDAGAFDAGPPGVDAGDFDAGDFDAGDGPCTMRDTCEDETAVVCVAGNVMRLDCPAMGAYCEMGSCVTWACMPDLAVCAANGIDVEQCDSRGTGFSVTESCTRGCDMGACRPQTGCSIAVSTTMGVGTYRVDLCGQGNDLTHDATVVGDGCGGGSANGPDVVVRVEIAERADYQFELYDDDGPRIVDPMMYLRSSCDVETSQLECDDDGRGSQDSIFTRTLDPGDYFVVLDCLLYNPGGPNNTRTCGFVELAITRQ